MWLGSRALAIFAYSLNAKVLRAHASGAQRLSDLEGSIGWAPQSSLRAAVANLCELGVLDRIGGGGPAGSAATGLNEGGFQLLGVAGCLEHWLLRAPTGPIALDGAAATGTIRALMAGWDSAMIRLLAERSLTLTELSMEIADLSYPAIERRLAKLRAMSLVTPAARRGRGKPYAASDWLRRAIAPLLVASRWECHHMLIKIAPISQAEVEAIIHLALPLVELPPDRSGVFTMAILNAPVNASATERVAGATVEMRQGSAFCAPGVQSKLVTGVVGTPDAWFSALIDGSFEGLEVEGPEPGLPLELVLGLHEVLFRPSGSAKLRAFGSAPA